MSGNERQKHGSMPLDEYLADVYAPGRLRRETLCQYQRYVRHFSNALGRMPTMDELAPELVEQAAGSIDNVQVRDRVKKYCRAVGRHFDEDRFPYQVRPVDIEPPKRKVHPTSAELDENSEVSQFRRKHFGDMSLMEYFDEVYAKRKGADFTRNSANTYRYHINCFATFVGVMPTMQDITAALLSEYAGWLAEKYKQHQAARGAVHVRTIARHFMPARFPAQPGGRKSMSDEERGAGDESAAYHVLVEQYLPSNVRVTSDSTRSQYKITFNQFAEYLGRPATLGDFDDEIVGGYLKWLMDERGLKAVTANQRRHYMLAFWRWCFRRKLVDTMPEIPKMVEPEPDRTAWTIAQLQKILAATEQMRGTYAGVKASDFWRVFHLVMFETGERTSAVLAIRWEWIDLERGTLRIPAEYRKGRRKSGIYYLRPHVVEELKAFREPARVHVFEWPYAPSRFYQIYPKLIRAAGFKYDRRNGPQKVRRSHASHLEAAGGDATRSLMHSQRSVTSNSYLDETIVNTAPEVLKLPVLKAKATQGGSDGPATPKKGGAA